MFRNLGPVIQIAPERRSGNPHAEGYFLSGVLFAIEHPVGPYGGHAPFGHVASAKVMPVHYTGVIMDTEKSEPEKTDAPAQPRRPIVH